MDEVRYYNCTFWALNSGSMTQVAPTQSGHISLFTMPCTWWRGSVCRMTSSLLQAHSETKPWTYETRNWLWPTGACEGFHGPHIWSMGRSQKLLCSKPKLIWTVWAQTDWMMPTGHSSGVIVLWHEHDYWPRAAGLVLALTITPEWGRNQVCT